MIHTLASEKASQALPRPPKREPVGPEPQRAYDVTNSTMPMNSSRT